jgi:hypothetical protein
MASDRPHDVRLVELGTAQVTAPDFDEKDARNDVFNLPLLRGSLR